MSIVFTAWALVAAAWAQSVPCSLGGPRAACVAACEGGDPEACAKAGVHALRSGEGLEQGIAQLRKACGARVALGCGALGSALVAGTGVPKDIAEGRKLFERACEGGDGLSCLSLGGLATGMSAQTPDLPAAARYYDRACTLGQPRGCAFTAAIIADGIVSGPGWERSRVLGLLELGCEGDIDVACAQLGDALRDGTYGPAQLARAATLHAKACRLGLTRACVTP